MSALTTLLVLAVLLPINCFLGGDANHIKIIEDFHLHLNADTLKPWRSFDIERASDACSKYSAHRRIECSSCMSRLVHSRAVNDSLTAKTHLWDAASRFDSVVTRLIDVYQSTIIPASSTKMCFIGEYSTQILSTILSLNGHRVVRLFLPLHQLTPDELSELEHLKASREADSLIIVEIPDFETFTHSVNSVDCDLFHFRLSSQISMEYVDELVNWLSDWPTALQSNSGMIPVILERHSSLGTKENIKVNSSVDGATFDNHVETRVKWTLRSKLSQSYYPTRMQNGITVDYSTESGLKMIVQCNQLMNDNPLVQSQFAPVGDDAIEANSIELLVGYGRYRRPHLFADFHRRQCALQHSSDHCINNNNSDSCAGLDKQSRVFHYKNMNNSVTERIYSKMRERNDYATDIYDTTSNTDSVRSRSSGSTVLIIATFCYNGELMVPLHLEYLYASVDMFIIVEARESFSGKQKDFLYIDKNVKMFEPYLDKIQFIVIERFPALPSDWFMLYDPLTVVTHMEHNKSMEDFGASWYRDRYQRDIVADFLDRVYPEQDQKYLLLVVDADELIALSDKSPSQFMALYDSLASPGFFVTQFFYYNFNCFVGKWYLSFLINDEAVRRLPLSAYRNTAQPTTEFNIRGWHLSYFSSYHHMVRKLESFAHLEFDDDKYKNIDNIADKVSKCQDILNRTSMSQFEDWESLPEIFRTFQPIVLRYQQDRWSHSHLLHATIWITIHEAFHLLPTAYDLQKAIKRMGFEKVHVRSEVDMSEYDRIDRLGVRDFNEHGLQLQISLVDHSWSSGEAGGFMLPTRLLLLYGDGNVTHPLEIGSCASLLLPSSVDISISSDSSTHQLDASGNLLKVESDSSVYSDESSEQTQVDSHKLRTTLLTCLDSVNQEF